MRCGSCRKTGAEAYTKINENDKRLDVLKKLNKNRLYNPKYSYFCIACIQLAEKQLSSDRLGTISHQNPDSFSVLNESNRNENSDSSKDEIDLIVASKICKLMEL